MAAATLRLRRRIVPSAGWPEPPPIVGRSESLTDDLGARVAFLWEETWLHRARIRTLGQLARAADAVELREGERLWAAGDDAEDALIVVDGRVQCETADGRQRFDGGRGAILGLEEALAVETRWCGAVVRAPGAALHVTRATLIDVLEDDPDSALALLAACATLASGLRDLLASALNGGQA